MRAEHSSLIGRDHLSFRSYYLPVKVGFAYIVLAHKHTVYPQVPPPGPRSGTEAVARQTV